jgi:carbon monoxide dehydrogenase subunit G
MASLTLGRHFDLDAPRERVWTYLTTPELVVTCLPGATLVSSSENGRSHEGTVTVKLGAMSVSYRGTAEFVEMDESGGRFRVSAKGREKTGAGSADMTLVASVLPLERGSRVDLEASVSVTGKIVTLGRGMIGIVSAQIMSDLMTCLSEKLASEADVGSSVGGGRPEAHDPRIAPLPGDAAESPTPAAAGPAVEPAAGLSLLWRALRSWLRRLFGGS